MDPIVTPLATGILMTLGATTLPKGDFDTVAGLLVNWASSGIQGGAVGLLQRIKDNTEDPGTGLPRNHDLQRASCDALRGAATALLLEAAGRLEPRKPWVPALADFLRRGRWHKEPLLNALDRPDLAELAGLRQAIASDRFEQWHNSLSLNEAELRSCFQGGRCSLGAVLPQRFEAWLLRQARDESLPQAILDPLREGWSPGGEGGATLRFEDVYCLHFREALKHRPEVFRILVADTLTDVDEAVARIEAGMNEHVDMARALLDGQEDLLKQMRNGQRELRESLLDTITVVGLLQSEVRAGNHAAAGALAEVLSGVQRLEAAFGELQRQLFGLTLLRPQATRPPAMCSDQGDLWLIQAKYRALPLVDRADTQASLWQWLHAARTVSVRLLVGDAGAGKTRLGMELVWRLAAEEGDRWHAGFVPSAELRRLASDGSASKLQWRQPTLVVVDYARAATDGLRALLRELARRVDDPNLPKLRLLLLERSASATKDWVDDLMAIESSLGGRAARELFDPVGPEPLSPLDVQVGRRQLFCQALRVLADRTGQAPLRVPKSREQPAFDEMLSQDDWQDPLVPVMSALVAHHERGVMHALHLSRTDLAWRLASFETERLIRFARTTEDGAPQRLFLHVAALAALCGGFSSDESFEVVRREVEATGWAWRDGPRDLAHKLSNAWSAHDGGVAELKPDVVAEAFVLMHLGDRQRLSLVEQKQAILRASSKHERMVADLVLRAFHNFQIDPRLGTALGEWTQALVQQGLARREPALIAAIDDAMPHSTVALARYAVDVTKARFELVPALDLAGDDAVSAEHARIVANLGVRLSNAGRREEALAPSEEAVEIYRALAARNPEAYQPALAMSLNNLAIRYAKLGRREEALATAEEAVEIRRARVARNPEAYRPALAMSLNTLANLYAELGRREEALAPAEEAEEIDRALVARDPVAYRPALAMSLNNLAIRYAELGRREEALAPAEEAEEIYRALVARNPDAYRPALASSLNNLAIRYAELGRREEALAPAEEALEIRRALVARNPDAYRPDLVSSMNSLAVHYAETEFEVQAKRLLRDAASLSEPPIVELLAAPGVRRAQRPAPLGSVILDWLNFSNLDASGRAWAVQAIGVGADAILGDRIMLRAAPLSFYPSALLLGALDPDQTLGQELFYVAQVGGEADRLDGTSASVHAANRLWALDLASDEQALDYARYFCCFVEGPDGPFRIVETGAHLEWLAAADAEVQGKVAALLQPARVKSRDEAGLIMVSATMLYGKSLFSVDLVLAGRALETMLPGSTAPRRMLAGQVEMLNVLELADLPLHRLAQP